MELMAAEKQIVREFKRRVEQQFPDQLVRLVLFGSKARGDSSAESDIDVLVVIRSEDWRLGDAIRAVGYALELEHGVVLSIQVMSLGHYDQLQACGSQFLKAVEREGVHV